MKILWTEPSLDDLTAIRDYIHVTDLGDAHVKALQYLLEGGDSVALNLGTGDGYSVKQVIETVEKVSGVPVPTQIAQRRAGDPPILVADAGKAGRCLGWSPVHSSLENIVSTAWRWHQSAAESAA